MARKLVVGKSAVHELTLQPELFHLCTEVDRPTAKAGFMADILYETGWDDEALINASNKVNYYKDKFDDDKKQALIDKCKNYWETRKKYEEKELDSVPIYLDPKNRDRLAGCIKALNDNAEIQKLLHPEGFLETPISENEQAILVDVQVKVPDKESFILRIKAKLDNYTIDKETNQICVNDVKTIGKIVSEFPSNFEKFRYCRELSLYSWLLSLCAKKFYKMDNPTIKSNCLVVSTIPSYYTSIYKVTNKDFTEGWNEFNFLLKLVAHYKSIGYEFV